MAHFLQRPFLFLLLSLLVSSPAVFAQTVGHTATGLASYYSDEFDGDVTAYDEIYRKNELVGAHSVYPHNSRVRVTNLANGNDVVVRIIDQGPWIEGRIIEVSRRAAELLGFGKATTIRVELELISTPNQPARTTSSAQNSAAEVSTRQADATPPPPFAPDRNAAPAEPRRTTSTPANQPTPTPAERQVTVTTQPAVNRANTTTASAEATTPTGRTFVPATAKHPMLTTGQFADGVYKIEIREVGQGSFGVQVASYSDLNSAMLEVSKLQAKWFDNILVRKAGTAYKVILGPFEDQESATAYNKDLKSRYKIKGFTVSIK